MRTYLVTFKINKSGFYEKSILSMALVSCSFASLAEVPANGGYVVLHQNAGYEGRELQTNDKILDLRQFNFNNMISSIEIPEGYKVEAFQNINFQGKKLILDESKDWIGDEFNDTISSLIVTPKVSGSGTATLTNGNPDFGNYGFTLRLNFNEPMSKAKIDYVETREFVLKSDADNLGPARYTTDCGFGNNLSYGQEYTCYKNAYASIGHEIRIDTTVYYTDGTSTVLSSNPIVLQPGQ